MGISELLLLTVLDLAISSNRPCYAPSDQTKFDEITRSLRSAQNDLSALRMNYRERVPTLEICEKGWKKYRNYCYMSKSSVKSWHDAVKQCNEEAASLVYINDDDENSWVANLCPGVYCWIGAHDLMEDSWLWSHNWANLTFTNWNINNKEPNGGTRENCGMIYGRSESNFKTWNDCICEKKLHYICKRAAPGADNWLLAHFHCQRHRYQLVSGYMTERDSMLDVHVPTIKRMTQFCQKIFPVVEYANAIVPSYCGGHNGFLLISKNKETDFKNPHKTLDSNNIEMMQLRYYNTKIHRASLCLPQEFREKIGLSDEN